MKIVTGQHHLSHDTSIVPIPPTGDFLLEVPSRVGSLLAAAQGVFKGAIVAPRDFGRDPIAGVHTGEYLDFLITVPKLENEGLPAPRAVFPEIFPPRRVHVHSKHPSFQKGWFASDTFSPLLTGTWDAAYWGAQIAVTAASELVHGAPRAYALCRPPGHHAYADRYGGFCYLNNVAIAARWLARQPGIGRRVAILDIDAHHGNGTQDIFYADGSIYVASLHGDPRESFPYFSGAADERGEGDGEGSNCNYPLPKRTGEKVYVRILEEALSALPTDTSCVVVALGFDTALGDPYGAGSFEITEPGFTQIGKILSQLSVPILFVQEGGYLLESLESNAGAFFRGVAA